MGRVRCRVGQREGERDEIYIRKSPKGLERQSYQNEKLARFSPLQVRKDIANMYAQANRNAPLRVAWV